MQMFETFLKSIPKNRSEMVTELELPEVTLAPYWEPELFTRSESSLASTEADDGHTLSTGSSIPLSRAMTDSEIDYGRAKRYKSRSITDPWDQLRAALDAFPPGHLDSLNSFQTSSVSIEEPVSNIREETRKFSKGLRRKMERFFKDECNVFSGDDPGLEALEEALMDVDLRKIIDDELSEGNS